MRKILRVDMSKEQVTFEDITDSPVDLGGRGLTSRIVWQEISALVDPLGPKNKVIFAPGILAGTTVPNSGRLSVGSKSPLTSGIKEANCGGTAAQNLARLGIAAMVIEGHADSLSMLTIDKNGVKFSGCSHLRSVGNYELVSELRGQYGDNVSIISIGPAGELGLKSASVAVTTPDFQLRFAGRGGLGAVMGSKNIKAIVIDDRGCDEVEVKDRAKLKEATRELSKGILANPLAQGLKGLGTPLLINVVNGLGSLATKNYSVGQFEGAEKLSGEHIVEVMKQRPNAKLAHRCMNGCIIDCSNVYTDEKGEIIASGLEYETLALVGSNCLIDDVDTIAHINRACNDMGVDTMDIGTAIAVAMEARLLSWGDGDGALRLVNEIARETPNGLMIGNGCKYTGDMLGVKRIPHVKGQSLAAYDPRGLKGTGVTYATSTMGADHTCGNALPSAANPEYNPGASTGQGAMSKFLQQYNAAIDTLGICLFASLPLLDTPELQKHLISCVSAVLGKPLEDDYLTNLGTTVMLTERAFNNTAGFGKGDDRLPEFFQREALMPSGNVFDVPEQDLESVYE